MSCWAMHCNLWPCGQTMGNPTMNSHQPFDSSWFSHVFLRLSGWDPVIAFGSSKTSGIHRFLPKLIKLLMIIPGWRKASAKHEIQIPKISCKMSLQSRIFHDHIANISPSHKISTEDSQELGQLIFPMEISIVSIPIPTPVGTLNSWSIPRCLSNFMNGTRLCRCPGNSGGQKKWMPFLEQSVVFCFEFGMMWDGSIWFFWAEKTTLIPSPLKKPWDCRRKSQKKVPEEHPHFFGWLNHLKVPFWSWFLPFFTHEKIGRFNNVQHDGRSGMIWSRLTGNTLHPWTTWARTPRRQEVPIRWIFQPSYVWIPHKTHL